MESTGGPPGDQRGDTNQQKRKRHAKKRRRSASSMNAEPANNGTKSEAPPAVAKSADDAATSTASAAAQWGCPACTFLNDSSRRFCEMCGTSNPSQQATAEPSEWHCVACTMKNAPSLRSCGVCGTINPNPSSMGSSVLSIARRSLHGGLFIGGDEGDEDDDDDDDDGSLDDSDSSGGSSDGDNSESGADRRLECPCLECGMLIAATESHCSYCHAVRPLPRRKLKRSDLSDRLHKLARKMNKKEKKRKDSKKEGKEVMNAYGVSSEVLKKLMLEPKSSKLSDTLQTLTHTLAMMDASADSEWGDMHAAGGAFLVHGFGASRRSDKGKDTALLGVLSSIFQDEKDEFPAEVRVFAVQSINYLLKMDRHLFLKQEALSTVRIYLSALKKWSSSCASAADGQMIVEECVNGLSGLCGSEGAMLRELVVRDVLHDFIQFLARLASASSLHSSVAVNALELFQKCCLKLKWPVSPDSAAEDSAIAQDIVQVLRTFMKHPEKSLHVTASKCLLMFIHRLPKTGDSSSMLTAVVTADLLRELVELLTSKGGDEPDDSRQAAATLLMHLLDSRPEMLKTVVQHKLYAPLCEGVSCLLSPANSTSSALSSHALKLVSLLIRRVSRATQQRLAVDSSDAKAAHSLCDVRFDAAPDATVLTTLLLDFVRLDSVPAVSVLLRDGAELNFSNLRDSSGAELDSPLIVAAEASSLGMVRFLIKRGAAVVHCGPSGTALHVAAARGRCDIVSFLLECGASPTDQDRQGRSVIKCLDDVDVGVEQLKSPVRRLLELHQRVLRLGEGSDASGDSDAEHGGATRRWITSASGHHEDEDDDDLDDDDDDEDDPYYDYDDEEDDDDDMGSDVDDDISSDEEEHDHAVTKTKSKAVTPSPNDKKKRRRESIASDASDHKKRRRANSTERRASTSPSKKRRLSVDDVDLSLAESTDVSDTILQCLLATLRAVDHTHALRSILSTLTMALELAPSALVARIQESDVAMLLETVNHLLQDSVRVVRSNPNLPVSTPGRSVKPAAIGSEPAANAEMKSMFASYILAFRLLLTIARKSDRESSIFYEIERRGICEQLERLCQGHGFEDLTSNQTDREGAKQMMIHGHRLLEFLRDNVIETGMLVLHRLKNMTRRLREVSDTTPKSERDLILVDLVELFDEQHAITSHEFKRSNLLEAILVFLMPPGTTEPSVHRVSVLLRHFSSSPAAFTSFLMRLQAVVNQEENLPLVSFFTGKGRELYPLTKQIKVVCARRSPDPSHTSESPKMLQLSPVTNFQSFEKTIFRCFPVNDLKLHAYYLSLVGHCIQRAVDNKWKKFWVCGYDSHRSTHLLKPIEDVADDVVEAVLHDSQYKLTYAVDVKEDVGVDFSLFGELQAEPSAAAESDEKKRKRHNKKRRRSSTDTGAGATLVEVQNASGVNAGKLRGAWYAGEIVPNAGDEAASDIALNSEQSYTVRLISSGNVLKSVAGKLVRARRTAPQVGSVVEVDGVLGEISAVHGDSDTGDSSLYDVKISRDRERKAITRHRIRYPPTSTAGSAPPSGGIIEAMSLSRLFPPRESSAIAGSVGDRVWLSALSADSASSSSGDIFLAGRIQSFPPGPDAVGDSASVFVEVAFGKSSSVLKVRQSRVINLGGGRNRLGSSRLLSALHMASERSGSSGSGPLHRLLQSGNRELFGNRPGGSSSAFDQLRQMLSQSSSASGREAAWASFSGATASTDSLGAASSTDGESTSKAAPTKEEDAAMRLSRVWKALKIGDRKKNWKCARPPRVTVSLAYDKCVNIDAAPFSSGGEEEFGASSVFNSSTQRLKAASAVTVVDPVTKKSVLKPAIRTALIEVFSTFEDEGHGSKSAKKSKSKKRKLAFTPTATPTTASSTKTPVISWDVDKFSAFTAAAYGQSAVEDPEGTLVDNCVEFSMFATVESRRRELTLDGFLASVLETCTTTYRNTQLLSFLKSRGYDVAPTADAKSEEAVDKSKATGDAGREAEGGSVAVVRSFSSDQNMLRCLTELQRAAAPQDVATSASPPWKLKYFVKCELGVEWGDSSTKSDGTDVKTCGDSSHFVTAIEGVDTEAPMMKAVRLLRYLYDAQPKDMTVASEVWLNARLAKKVQTQMEDVLSICSGVYPSWCDAVVSECKFFFPRELRERLFRATAFGCTRSLHWFRNQLNMDDSSSAAAVAASSVDGASNGVPGIAADGIYNHEISISPIPKERVKVNRDSLLDSADAVMKMHGKRKAILDIVFVGEKGYGSGVTAAFYSATAQTLQSVAENRNVQTRLWVPGIENDRQDDTIRHPNGLFPFPHMELTLTAKIAQRFRMMGSLAGKALMDDRLFPLPLSREFIQLVVGQRVEAEALDRIFLQQGKVLKSMKRAVDQIDAGAKPKDVTIDGMAVKDWLAAVDFTFIDPLSQQPLEPKGDEKPVTLENMKAYVAKVTSLWLHDGIKVQVEAFRDGLSEVLPLAKLNLLFVPEILSMLCGDGDILWDKDSLLTTMKLAHGYTKDSMPVQYFVESLVAMTVEERRQFLLYATGCPNLPAGGFASLKPAFEVVRRVVETDNVDTALPFARTCTNTLHLPAYSSQQVLDERVRYAIANSAGVIDRD